MLLVNMIEVSTPQKVKENMPYLAVGNGWAGKLALNLGSDFGFSEMVELGQVSHGIWKSVLKS